MPLFFAIGYDHPPHMMALRDELRAAHRQYVMIDRTEPIRFAGAMLDDKGNQCGSTYVMEAGSAQEIMDWFKTEPFYAAGVYKSVDIRPWGLGYNGMERMSWPLRPGS